jgi:hypothetical protein
MEITEKDKKEATPVVEPTPSQDTHADGDDIKDIQSENITPTGLSADELNDPNKIVVEIVDKKTPIVILFGPPACGKTMTLLRLTLYLKDYGYTIDPDESFRPSYDTNYKEVCRNFKNINSKEAAKGTSSIGFMLVKVYDDKKNCLCQILEAPGEYYFSKDAPDAQFPAYIYDIISSPNRKIWTFMVEPNWQDHDVRIEYTQKIKDLMTKLKPKDKSVILFNKIDRTHVILSGGHIKMAEAQRMVNDYYPNLFSTFKNNNPITKIWKQYNCDFVPFQTGSYPKAIDGSVMFRKGSDDYPKMLWETIMRLIRG